MPTAHSNCSHPATKADRARCRRNRKAELEAMRTWTYTDRDDTVRCLNCNIEAARGVRCDACGFSADAPFCDACQEVIPTNETPWQLLLTDDEGNVTDILDNEVYHEGCAPLDYASQPIR